LDIMKIRYPLFALLMIAASLLTIAPVHAQTREISTSGELLDRVVAQVDEGVVLQSELDSQMTMISQRLIEQGVELPPDSVLRQQVLERLVLTEIQMQRANDLDIRVSDEQLNGALVNVASRHSIPFNDLPAVLAAEGIEYGAYREEMRREMIMGQLRQRDVESRVNVTPRELDQYLAKQSERLDANAEYELAHILISLPGNATPEQIKTAETKAQDLYRTLLQGADFGQTAVASSESRDALEGGYLGWLKSGEVPTLFADIIPTLGKGQVSEPVRSGSGYHLLKLMGLRGVEPVIVSQIHTRHILIMTNEILDSESAHKKLQDIRKRIVEDGEDFGAVAKAISDDPGSAAEGGDLGWATRGRFVKDFEDVADTLEENEISEPFKTQFGWHILQLLGKRQHDSTAENRRNQAFQALRQRKVVEQTEIWMRRIRDEAFVEIRL
jgi:peptidyl-prolyl cis-trans isomerase SurA